MSTFSFDTVPVQKGCRWFVKKGDTTPCDRGFRSKEEADQWIKSFGDALDWRAGYAFALRGDPQVIEICNCSGEIAKP